MHITVTEFTLGLLLSTAIAGAAYRKKSLSTSGFWAAIVLGTSVFALGSWLHWALLILFFISSSLLSSFKRQKKKAVEADFAKTGCRDWLQVLANGSIGLGYALAWRLSGEFLFCVGYIAAFATVNADTWATEIGVLSRNPPISILTYKPTSPGASGAISALGTGAAMTGAGFISLAAAIALYFTGPEHSNIFVLFLAATAGGVFGCFVDSLMGATVQAMYKCPQCGKLTERTIHHNQTTELVRGFRFFHNDMVNFSSSLLGSILAMLIYKLLV